MKKKISLLCSVIVVLSICITIFGATNFDIKDDVTTVVMENHHSPKTETTTSNALGGLVEGVVGGIGSGSSGDIGDVLGGIGSGSSGSLGDSIGNIGSGSSGGIGDAIGGIGDALGDIGDGFGDIVGGIFDGSSSQKPTTAPVQTTSADIGLIIPVPAATQTSSESQTESTSSESSVEGETVDFSLSSNPYKKPTSDFVAGDEDETIKWLQWIFVYTGYGLKDDGITGVLDEDTVAVVKKLQHENKMTVDGNITEDVIKAAEVLYYQSILGDDVSAIEISSHATTAVRVSYESVESEKGDDISVVLLIVILVIIWILAIGGIILLFVFKKKKIASQKADQEKSEEKKYDSQTEKTETVSSIADLFEEAEKHSK